MSCGTSLRNLLASSKCEYLLEAHNAVSARIAAESGAPGLWASSLTLSCSMGLRDNSELTMTEALSVLESITSHVSVPLLFDGDTGYGTFAHFQILVRRLIGRAVAGVCIEDKLFPKTNSFLFSERQELASVEEFCGKIRAGKDAQTDPSFVIVARTEALITGLGMAEALSRAERYAEAGADAILIHSKEKTFSQVAEFASRWTLSAPLICVPTTYPSVSLEDMEHAGISLAIWANHMLRSAVTAMQNTAETIAHSRSTGPVEGRIATVREVFRLQNAADLGELEARYLKPPDRRAVILASTCTARELSVYSETPPCMLPVDGVPLIHKLLEDLRTEGVREIAIVRDSCGDRIQAPEVTFYDSPAPGAGLAGLAAACEALSGDVLLLSGDIVFKRYVLRELLASDAQFAIVVDAGRANGCGMIPSRRVRASRPAPHHYASETYYLSDIGDGIAAQESHGEWIGLMRTRGAGTALLRQTLNEILAEPGGEHAGLEILVRRMAAAADSEVQVLYIHHDWARMGESIALTRAAG